MQWNRALELRTLPAVHKLLADPQVQQALAGLPRATQTAVLNEALAELRNMWTAAEQGMAPPPSAEQWAQWTAVPALAERVRACVQRRLQPQLRPVLNLTGVVLHTNLGRAPLSERALTAVWAVGGQYSNLEFDLGQGGRGWRHSHVEARLCRLIGAEAALVVNNNAAAVWLTLSALASGGEAVVSRGQLVEIGGSFRIPELMQAAGVTLVEVGSTNKTRLADYERAITPQTRLLVRVHTSNYRIVGFAEQPALTDLAALSQRCGVPLYEDLGSGALFDFARYGIGDEPTVQHSLQAGVDLISFSGDKLLGGAQAGIVAGRRELVQRLARHPLARALRVDKLTLAALDATLAAYEAGTAQQELPVIWMLTQSYADVAARCRQLADRLRSDPAVAAALTVAEADDVSHVGGGALPETALPTRVLRLTSRWAGAQQLAALLRTCGEPPVIGRIGQDAVVLDVRTLLPGQDEPLLASVAAAAKAVADGLYGPPTGQTH
ncbi:MAG: L-seryl-tRNA(Sec) selenium transferase [Alicyclobacillus sp.]|nr:L-seryl-tRNA(Sec) selenium transferase [Alicyclobacillus sp.]